MTTFQPDAEEPTIGPEPVGPAPAPILKDEPAAEVVEETPTAEQDMFPRSYVEELRQEAADRRLQLREYEEAFGELDADDRSTVLEFFKLQNAANRGDVEAAQQLEAFYQEDPEPIGEQPPLTMEDFRAMAREEAQTLIQTQQAQQFQAQAVQTVQDQAKTLGYELGSDDYVLLMKRANGLDPEGVEDLLTTAHTQITAEKETARQAIIDAYIAEKEAVQSGSPALPQTNGATPSLRETPRTFVDAREALHERLAQLG